MSERPSTEPLTREQVLAELELLANVEHALIVEYLSVFCALGHDLGAAEGGASSEQGLRAAPAASSLAQNLMYHLADLMQALVSAGRFPELGRATSITTAAGTEIPLNPPTLDQLRDLRRREQAIAAAVDQHYARLRPAVTTAPLFEGGLLDRLAAVVETGGNHGLALTDLRDALVDPPPDLLRAVRRETNDVFEQGLLEVSDRCYRLVTEALSARFAQPDVFGFTSLARTAMDALDGTNRALVRRGLLPPFTL